MSIDVSSHDSAASCPVCGGALVQRLEPWLFLCRSCHLWRSTLNLKDRLRESQILDESKRIAGLRPLRDESYAQTLRELQNVYSLAGKRLLDVGCGYGWFLNAARAAEMEAVGIEPDLAVASEAARSGVRVVTGYFPEILGSHDTCDVISFMDVLEHIVDLDTVLNACRHHLVPGGIIVISAPSSRGILFRVATFLARFGLKNLLNRLWQKDYASPHITYFDAANLTLLVKRYGFTRRVIRPLRSLRLQGMWARLHMDRQRSIGTLLTYLVLVVALPVIRILPSDQLLSIFVFEPDSKQSIENL